MMVVVVMMLVVVDCRFSFFVPALVKKPGASSSVQKTQLIPCARLDRGKDIIPAHRH